MLKTKILGLVLMLGLATVLGACESGSEPGGEAAPVTPAPGEPTDGATPSPAPTATPAPTPGSTP
ncbi:MAG TPA: hypothetical protein VE956_19320 [Nodularia sp. (in: cyanobacteria)]|nr:hypothetical protein [Nodularia sp. (in: cyanobacteria)]